MHHREWDVRVARGMMHLREALPQLFSAVPARTIFPPDVYSRDVVLRLPHPLPLRIGGLHAYGVAFTIARNGMQGE
jgi:hypothetical protein